MRAVLQVSEYIQHFNTSRLFFILEFKRVSQIKKNLWCFSLSQLSTGKGYFLFNYLAECRFSLLIFLCQNERYERIISKTKGYA